MTSYLQKAGTRLFEKNLEQYQPEDPLYEFYTDDRGKQRRRKVRPNPYCTRSRLVTDYFSSARYLPAFQRVTQRFSSRCSAVPTI
jgi:hypothetical protein